MLTVMIVTNYTCASLKDIHCLALVMLTHDHILFLDYYDLSFIKTSFKNIGVPSCFSFKTRKQFNSVKCIEVASLIFLTILL